MYTAECRFIILCALKRLLLVRGKRRLHVSWLEILHPQTRTWREYWPLLHIYSASLHRLTRIGGPRISSAGRSQINCSSFVCDMQWENKTGNTIYLRCLGNRTAKASRQDLRVRLRVRRDGAHLNSNVFLSPSITELCHSWTSTCTSRATTV